MRHSPAGSHMRPAADAAPGGGAPMRACSASSSSVAGRSVRWMVKLQPSRSVSARISARWRATRVAIVRLPGFGAAGRDRAGAFRLDELDAARNRERSLPPDRRPGRDGHARRSTDSCDDGRAHLGDRAPEVRRPRRSRKARDGAKTAAGSRARSRHATIAFAILSSTLRLPVGRIRPGTPTRSPACTSTSASAKAMHQRAVELRLVARASSVKSMEGERSGQIHTVCAASHSRSRT